MRQSYVDYAMSVIVGRALPDVRDGLKPVHRRVLFAMHDMGNHWNNAYRKSARVVGGRHREVPSPRRRRRLRRHRPARPGLLHALLPGGRAGATSAPSTAIRRPPCATRKSAWRASPKSCSRTSRRRPSTSCPTTTTPWRSRRCCRRAFPTCSSTARRGIAVGMATNIPPHNLGEVIDGLIALVERPGLTIDDADGVHPRARLSHGRVHSRPRRHRPGVQDRAWQRADARAGLHRDRQAYGQGADHRLRGSRIW